MVFAKLIAALFVASAVHAKTHVFEGDTTSLHYSNLTTLATTSMHYEISQNSTLVTIMNNATFQLHNGQVFARNGMVADVQGCVQAFSDSK